MFFLFSLASSENSVLINEIADFTSLEEGSVQATYRFSKEISPYFSDQNVKDLCRGISLSSCSSQLINNKEIVIKGKNHPNIEVLSYRTVEKTIFLKIKHAYTPFTYIFSPWNKIAAHDVDILYPDFQLSFRDFIKDTVINEMSINRNTTKFQLLLENDQIEAGNLISLPDMEASHCFIEFLSPSGKNIFNKTVAGCKNMFITTKATLGPGIYKVNVLAFFVGDILSGQSAVSIIPSSVIIDVKADKTKIRPGDIIKLLLTSSSKLDSCTFLVYDSKKHPILVQDFFSCDSLIIATDKQWTDKNYLILIKGKNSLGEGFATLDLSVELPKKINTDVDDTFLEPNPTVSPISESPLEKTHYSAGDRIVSHFDVKTPVDFVETKIYDENHNIITETECINCEKSEIELDKTLKTGNYIVETIFYKDGKIVKLTTTPIKIDAWNALAGSDMDKLCPTRHFSLDYIDVSCISPGQMCVPSYNEVPLCLCFDSKQYIVDVCNSGGRCSSQGCKKTTMSPYTVFYHEGECKAKMGTQTINCINEGEICSGSCLCVSQDKVIVSSCSYGDLCSAYGCTKPNMLFSLESFSPETINKNMLKNGVEFSWKGLFKYFDKYDFIKRNNISVYAQLGDRRYNTEILKDDAQKGTTITSKINAELDPGVYNIYLVFIKGDDTFVLKKRLQINYNEKEIIVSIERLVRDKFSLNELKHSTTLELHASIKDIYGKDILSLRNNAFKLFFNDEEQIVRSSSFEKHNKLWSVRSKLQKQTVSPGNAHITLKVDDLGRSGSEDAQAVVLEKIPLDVRVLKTSPGTEENPVFYLSYIIGLDLEIYLEVKGIFSGNKEDMRIKINEKDITDKITYFIGTESGIKVHLSNIQLCPNPPLPDASVSVSVSLFGDDEKATDSARLYIKDNPGSWSNLEEAKCV